MNKTPVTERGIDVIGRKGMLSVNCASNKYENQLANDCTHSVHEAEINITVPIKDVGKMLPKASLAIMGKSVQSYSIMVVDPHSIPITSPLHPHHISIEAISPLNPHIPKFYRAVSVSCCKDLSMRHPCLLASTIDSPGQRWNLKDFTLIFQPKLDTEVSQLHGLGFWQAFSSSWKWLDVQCRTAEVSTVPTLLELCQALSGLKLVKSSIWSKEGEWCQYERSCNKCCMMLYKMRHANVVAWGFAKQDFCGEKELPFSVANIIHTCATFEWKSLQKYCANSFHHSTRSYLSRFNASSDIWKKTCGCQRASIQILILKMKNWAFL